MQIGFLGVDIGSISTKGVIVDEENRIIAEQYIWTEGNPIHAVKNLLTDLEKQIRDKQVKIEATGTTGSARKLIGSMLNADVVKNEITAHAVGTMSVFPDVRTIFEIGGQDSKIMLIEDRVVVDYAMNTLCAAGTGAFLSSQAKRLGIAVESFGEIALKATNPSKIAARCTVFAESDLVHKAQIGHKKEDIVAGLCMSVVTNYLNNVGKGKNIKSPIVFQGGVSKNVGVIKAFETATGERIHVDPHGHLMGALGVAILAKNAVENEYYSRKCNSKECSSKKLQSLRLSDSLEIDDSLLSSRKKFDFDITNVHFETKGVDCTKCANNCEIICFYKNEELIDLWGNRCERGAYTNAY